MKVNSINVTLLNEYPIYGSITLPVEHRCQKCKDILETIKFSESECDVFIIRLGVSKGKDSFLPLSLMFSNNFCFDLFDNNYSHIDLTHFTEVIIKDKDKKNKRLKNILRKIIHKIILNHYYANII